MSASSATTPRTSLDMIKTPMKSSAESVVSSNTTLGDTSRASSLWRSVKRHAKEHHDSVNAAYITYYGGAVAVSTAKQQEVWQYQRRSR
ncbi:predicted protein [Plenodomus lingam JN3]|uniref:Predicted protein n=2 Tax=Leptosphaeria maculans TaxID=5022 RepID=E5A0N2_LEPMJ|nr:predicted protein [Plenodomus lingam JN3]CBX97178.1 predicted protein [Plenodomus lingam JN3]